MLGERDARYLCTQYGQLCPAHDLTENRWRHLSFIQYECDITAELPRTKCPEHGVHVVQMRWIRKARALIPLFEQAALPAGCGTRWASRTP